MYPDLLSSIVPVPHYPELCVHTLPERKQPSSEESRISEEVDLEDPDYTFRGAAGERNPYYPNQRDLSDFIRYFGLTKSNAELLTSRLKEWDLLDKIVQIASQRKCHQHFSSFFTRLDGLCFCHNISGLCVTIGIAYNLNEWHLFIYRSSRSLKAVLPHNWNKYLFFSSGSIGAPQRGIQ
ncbi:uncharacterized protein LOC143247160 [Tachypleus tridentatus]|uniref:uncharacterized protein LOC143247160 n=1 Tax=Tachypleus tridentatus TaxID=6853 RepID=UPI003FD0EB0A